MPTEPEFSFRPLARHDLPMLREWLCRPHLQRWWRQGEPSPEEIEEKYLPRIAGEDDAVPFIATLNDEPVGYIQYYRVPEGNSDWWPDEPGPGVVGIDLFLADRDRLGKGIGTQMISAFVDRLFQNPAIREIRIDPRPDNLRAIRSYEKAGFRPVQEMDTPNGPALWMTRVKPIP